MFPRWALRAIRILLLLTLAGCGGFNATPTVPAGPGDGGIAPPAPPVEIPSFLRLPSSLSIDVNEIGGSGGAPLVAALAVGSTIERDHITAGSGLIDQTNRLVSMGLFPLSFVGDVPVNPFLVTREVKVDVKDDDGVIIESPTVKLDFRPFDQDGDGVIEDCSGCTCPTGCAPDIAACPTEAPAEDLMPICVRAWLDDVRYMAGLFDRVPTATNEESGRLRFRIVFGDLTGSAIAADYNHHDPENSVTDLSFFMADEVVLSDDPTFQGRRRTTATAQGPKESAEKTVNLATETLAPVPAGSLQYQANYRTDADFMSLEVIYAGLYEALLDDDDVTPPACVQISSGIVTNDTDCSDIDLGVTAGDFVPLLELSDVLLPPADLPLGNFPNSPTF